MVMVMAMVLRMRMSDEDAATRTAVTASRPLLSDVLGHRAGRYVCSEGPPRSREHGAARRCSPWCVVRGGSPLQCICSASSARVRPWGWEQTADCDCDCGLRGALLRQPADLLTAAAAGRLTAAPVRGSRCGAVCSAA